ncbi:hypothetical protein GCM10027275_39230 [Rhabdobacter roseus]|uniref:Putative membrane protein n=1 Tax=Rhabdobacter roseus TaxID=1655419 RepID=A0A840TZM7_9BACT|nr:hypothetical protein [Rhabdobacter roseus]MBB5285628.1 putative membrane protein [Rhabdobacter roseus]
MENRSILVPPRWEGSLSFGWQKMKQYFLPLLLVVLVLCIADAPLESLKKSTYDRTATWVLLEILAVAYWLLLLPVFDYSADLLFIQAIRNQKLDLKDIVVAFKNYLNVVLTHLLVTALIGISMIALIIPGIIVACRLAFTSYLVMDKGLDPIAAVETSWKMTSGHGWRIFGLGATAVFIFFLGLLCFIVGILPALIWIKASFASLYEAVLIERGEADSPELPAEAQL